MGSAARFGVRVNLQEMVRARAQRLTAALAIGAVMSVGGACSFVTSFDGLTTADAGIDSGPRYQGPPPSEDSGGVTKPSADAGASDAPVGDGGEGAPDVGSDDASDGAAAVTPDGSFCASLEAGAALFCDDFDESVLDAAALTAPWDQVTGIGGSVVRSSAAYASAPLSMLVTSTAGASQIDLCGYKSFKSAPTTGTYALAFDLDVVGVDKTNNSDAILAAMELIDETGGARWALQLEVNYDSGAGALDVNFSQNQSFSDGGSSYTSHPVQAALAISAWTHVSMTVVIGTSDSAALVLGAAGGAKISIAPGTVNAYPEILVGGTFAKKSTEGWTAYYDNVTFSAQ
jgi:hypothetical protein